MKRKDCFFGLHFDFHANENTKDIGKYFDDEVLEKIVTEVKPDFIQCDTKGHPGYASYKTKIGNAAPGLCIDLLAKWRKITKKHGVLLYSHYSGVWDKKVAKEHPEWAITYADGKKSDAMSTFSPYADNVLIPQLKEVALDYGVDGAWVDGDCWYDCQDSSPEIIEAFQKEYGFNPNGEGVTTEQKLIWNKYNREAFFKYVDHYIKEIKKAAPNFEVTSNWLNSAQAPEAINITDYISGDLSPTNSVDSARYDARVMAAFHRNFDLLSWAISFPVHYAKSSIQLCQEAAIVMSLGGGYQIYNMQSPVKVVMDPWAIPSWKEVSDFCHKCKPFCLNSKPIHDIGLIYSVDAHYMTTTALFQRDCEYDFELYGLLLTLLDNGRSVDVINSQLIDKEDLSSYNMIVISNSLAIEPRVKEKILEYIANGGEVLLEGANTIKLFKDDFQLSFANDLVENGVTILNGKDYSVEVRRPYIVVDNKADDVLLMNECDVYGDINCWNPPPSISPRLVSVPSSFSMKYKKGKVHFVSVNIGKNYLNDRTFEMKYYMRDVLSSCPKSKATINKNGEADLVLRTNNGKTYLHVINLLGEHRSQTVKTFDSIPSLNDVVITYECSKPKKVVLQPEGKEIHYEYSNGVLTIKLDKVDLYSIIELEL